MSDTLLQVGVIKKWRGAWGIIYCPGDKQYFLHRNQVTSGEPQNGARATFRIGPQRSAADLPQALDVQVAAPPVPPVNPGVRS